MVYVFPSALFFWAAHFPFSTALGETRPIINPFLVMFHMPYFMRQVSITATSCAP